MPVDPTQFPMARAADTVAAASIIGTMMGWLPYVAAIVSTIYFMIMIYESHTYTIWRENRMIKRRARKIAKLKAKEKVLSAEILAMEAVRSAKGAARMLLADAKTEAALDVVQDQLKSDIETLEKKS